MCLKCGKAVSGNPQPRIILLSWLNDHPAGVGTFCAETDTIQCDEDMV